MALAYIGIGSNIGDRLSNIYKAVSLIEDSPDVRVTNKSSLYETVPVGYLDQPDFLNAVIEIKTSLKPLELLQTTKRIENKMRRKRERRWGPRTIDLDILLYDEVEMNEPHLHLPHPEITNRAFVLVPLSEIAGGLTHPIGKTINELLADLKEPRGVKFFAHFQQP